MSRQPRSKEEPGLFDDLPLQPQPRPSPAPPIEPEHLPLFEKPESPAKGEPPRIEAPSSAPGERVTLRARLSAAAIDLGVVVAVLALIRLGLWGLGVVMDSADLVPLLIFLLPFSFLYLVFPLAFWGRTPGMAKSGIVAHSDDGRSLSFAQAALRWIAGVVSVLTLGLPMLLVKFTGRSLADRISQSQLASAR